MFAHDDCKIGSPLKVLLSSIGWSKGDVTILLMALKDVGAQGLEVCDDTHVRWRFFYLPNGDIYAREKCFLSCIVSEFFTDCRYYHTDTCGGERYNDDDSNDDEDERTLALMLCLEAKRHSPCLLSYIENVLDLRA